MDEEAIKQVTIQRKWPKTKVSNLIFQGIIGNGLVAIEGDTWKNHRTIIMPSFSQMNIKSMTDEIVKVTMEKLDSFEKNNKKMIFEEFTENVSTITLAVIAAVGFGGDIDGIDELTEDFVNLVEDYFPVMLGLIFFGKWFTKLPFPHHNKYYKTKENLERKVIKIIEKKKKEFQNTGSIGRDLLSMMIDAQDEEGKNFTNSELFDESLTFLFAGHDT